MAGREDGTITVATKGIIKDLMSTRKRQHRVLFKDKRVRKKVKSRWQQRSNDIQNIQNFFSINDITITSSGV